MKKKTRQNRRMVVVGSLVVTLSLTTALLVLLAPPPLTPNAATSLMATDSGQSLDAIYATVPPTAGQWKFIYIRHSKTPSGNADSLAQARGSLGDHFVIGNGFGAGDGELQVGYRWTQQLPALGAGGTRVDPSCISVCLIGDFDRSYPTTLQMKRLRELVHSLQSRYGARLYMIQQAGSEGAVGTLFPVDAMQ